MPKKSAKPEEKLAPPRALTGRDRSFLRGLAHAFEPVMALGKGGLAEGVLKELDRVLLDHELVKLRVLREFPNPIAEATLTIESALRAHTVGQVGRIVILYRRHPTRPKLELPKPTRATPKADA